MDLPWVSMPCPCGSVRDTSVVGVREKARMQTPRPAGLAPGLLDKASPWPWPYPGSRHSWGSQLLASGWHVPTQSYFISVVVDSSCSAGLRGRAAGKTIFSCTRALTLTAPNAYNTNEWAFQVMGFELSPSGDRTQPPRLGRGASQGTDMGACWKNRASVVAVLAAKGPIFINEALKIVFVFN